VVAVAVLNGSNAAFADHFPLSGEPNDHGLSNSVFSTIASSGLKALFPYLDSSHQGGIWSVSDQADDRKLQDILDEDVAPYLPGSDRAAILDRIEKAAFRMYVQGMMSVAKATGVELTLGDRRLDNLDDVNDIGRQ